MNWKTSVSLLISDYLVSTQNLEAKVLSLQGQIEEEKIEKLHLHQGYQNQLEEIKRLRSVEAEKSSVVSELQEVSSVLISH